MAEYVQLPDGSYLQLKAGQSSLQALAEARQLYPDAFATPAEAGPKRDTSGFKAAASAGWERLKGEAALTAGKIGLMDTAAAEQYRKDREAAATARFTPTQEGWTEAPFLKFKETLGGALPYMAAPAAAGLGALTLPVSAPTAAGLGLLGAGAVSTGQFTGSNLGRQVDEGKTLEQASGAAAFGAAVPQALLDTAAMALLPGVGKLFGSVGSKLTVEQAKAIATQTLAKTAADYAAKTGVAMTREGFTEAAQQALERVQAGLNIADPQARAEYIDSFIGGAVLAGAGAPIGRAYERSGAKAQAAKADREERRLAQETAAKEAETQRAAEEAQRNTPEYAVQIGEQYEAMEQQKKALQSQIAKGSKDAPLTEAQKAQNAEITAQLRELQPQLKEAAKEYNRTAQLRTKAQEDARAAEEKARIAALSPEEYAAEQAEAPPQVTVKKAAPVEGDPFAAPQPIDVVQAHAAKMRQVAEQYSPVPPTTLDFVQYALRDPVMADQMVKTRTALPGMNRKEADTFLGSLKLNLDDAKTRFQKDLAARAQARTQALESEEAEAGAFTPPPAEQLAPGVGSEIMALRRMAARPAGVADQFDMFGQPGEAPAPSAAIGQMQQKLTGQDVTFTAEEEAPAQRGEKAPFELRAQRDGAVEPKPVQRDELLDRINRVLSTYDLSPEAVEFLKRVEQTLPKSDTEITREPRTANVKGRQVKVEQGTGSYFDLLSDQLERIESGAEGVPRKGERRTTELQAFPTGPTRAETAAPTTASAADIERYRSVRPGQARSVGPTAQAEADKRREEGRGGPVRDFVYQPAEDKRVAKEAGATPVSKRVTDITPSTLRGASAKPVDLSLADQMEEQLRLLETVADEGVQRPLFPETQDSVKLTPAAFRTYLRSPKVQKLREALARDQKVIERAQKELPQLEKRAQALIDRMSEIVTSQQEYRAAEATARANPIRREIAEIREAAGQAVVNRMWLASRLKQLQADRRDLIEAGRRQGETVEPDFLAELNDATDALQEVQNDMALLDAALSTLDGQLRSFAAFQKMRELPALKAGKNTIPALQNELRAVTTEMDKLRRDYQEVTAKLRKDAAEKKRAEAAVREAERKALVEAGRVRPDEEAKTQLPEYDKATQYPALTAAARMAREKGGAAPELTEYEKVQIKGDPNKVLGGYRTDVRKLEKAIKQAQDSARQSLYDREVAPKQALLDRLNKQYKETKSADAREALMPRIDAVQRMVDRVSNKVRTQNITWRGMKNDIRDLARAINRVEWLEGLIAEGRVEDEVRVPSTYLKKDSVLEQAQQRRAQTAAAAERTTAPKTSGEALTRSQVAKAVKPQKTLYEGKGGLSAQQILQQMQATAAERNRTLYRVSEGAKGFPVNALERLVQRVTDKWTNVPKVVIAPTFNDLPAHIRKQVEADDVVGKVPGLYDTQDKTVYLVADALHSPEDVYATIAHEVTGHFGLREMLGGSYAKTMNDIYNGNKAIREQADERRRRTPGLSREVSVEEVLAEMAEVDPNAKGAGPLRTLYNAIRNWFRTTFGFDSMSDKAIQQIVANARKYVIEGGTPGDGAAPTGRANYRTRDTGGDPLRTLADKITAEPKSFKERFASLTALELEQTAVDMRAGLREALKAGAEGLGDTKLFEQTMYSVLKADQKMPLTYTVMSRGPLELYKDDAGMYGVRSTNKNSAVDVFEAINELPLDDAKDKMAVAQAYLVAQRANNKGLATLDLGALGVKQSDLDAALAQAEADKALGAALEKVRRVYNAYNKGLVDFMAATGAIPKAVANKLNAAGDYVPFYRVDGNGNAELVFDNDSMVAIGDIRRQPYLAELKGGETRLLPLDEAIPRNTILLTDKALTNMSTKAVAYGLQAIGKPAGKMQIHSGQAPANPGVIKFNQEPDPSNPKDTGERWVQVDTEGTLAEGVPTALLVKSLEGAHMPLPGFLKLAGAATDILRAGVTRTPLYIARQLLREPMAAAFTGGLNYNTFTAVLKGGMKFVEMTRGNSAAEAKLLEKGLIQSGIFSGDIDDMGKFALQLVKGDQNAVEKLFAWTDRQAIKADASTRALVYENAIANGLSEVQADMVTMESMNFYKRGTSPTVQYASRLIPFFNAQIQGLNVLAKAARGRMPFEEQQQIKRKFFNNAALLAATGIVYAMAMEDDETWRNARPRDKMTNFFVPLPGTDEMLKLPIPFEAGYFYSLAVAAVDGMREQTDNAAQWQAIRDIFLNSVPGYSSMGVPQLVKPIAEVWTNKNFMSGAPIESLRLQGLKPEERYNATTTEFAKMLSSALPVLSPIQIEHLVRGYFGVLPLAAAATANGLFADETAGEKPEKRLSETPLLGSTFQKKYGGADADVVFQAAKDSMEARATLNKMLSEGRREDAAEFREANRVELVLAGPAGQYRQLVGRINADIRRTQERADLTAAEKRVRLDRLEAAKQDAAERFLEARRKAEEQAERTTRQ